VHVMLGIIDYFGKSCVGYPEADTATAMSLVSDSGAFAPMDSSILPVRNDKYQQHLDYRGKFVDPALCGIDCCGMSYVLRLFVMVSNTLLLTSISRQRASTFSALPISDKRAPPDEHNHGDWLCGLRCPRTFSFPFIISLKCPIMICLFKCTDRGSWSPQ
jgi:hypothetical protein